MGNNNSAQGNRSINPPNNIDPINDIQQTVNDMYNKIMGREPKQYQPTSPNSNVHYPTVDSDYDVLSTNKGNFPYMVSNSRLSESDPMTTSDIRVIEVFDCTVDENNTNEANLNVKKYAVNKKKPDHYCGANCPCIQAKSARNLFSPTSPSLGVFEIEFSPACSFNSKSSQNTQAKNTQTKNTQTKNINAMSKNNLANIFNTNNTLDKNSININTKSKMWGGASLDKDDEDDEDTLSSTSEITTTTDEPKKKKNKDNKKKNQYNDNDDNDDIDDDIDEDDIDEDDLDDDLDNEGADDDLTEEGFIIEQSDINTSDLYKMQKRIFNSETETEERYTDKVRSAMNIYNQRKKIFDTEDQDILNMNSSTDEYTRKPTRKNSKYH